MSPRITVEVHRHGLEHSLNISHHVVALSWSRSIYQPWETATLGLKTTMEDSADIVRPGDWVVARDETSKTIFWGHVADVGGGVSAAGARVYTDVLQVAVESWLSFLHRTMIYVPVGDAVSRGTLLNVIEWVGINASVLVPVWDGRIGAALQLLHEQVARIDLPASLGRGTIHQIAKAIPVVYDEDTALKFAPGRSNQVDAMNVGRGNQTMLNWGFYQGSIAESYVGTFVPEPMLIELFPSLEDIGTSGPTALGEFLGAQPVLIYRIRPWRSKPLAEAASTFVNFPPETDTVSFADHIAEATERASTAGQISLEKALLQAQAAAYGQSIPDSARLNELQRQQQAQSHAAMSMPDRQLSALANIFREVTWDVARFGKRLNPQAIRAIRYKWSDSNRTNVTAIIIGTDGKTGGEANVAGGLPLTNDPSILAHGARVVKPSITFNLESPQHESFTDQFTFMRSYAAQIMQFQWGAHAMSSGEITLNPVDLRGSESVISGAGVNQSSIIDNRLRAGEILVAKAPGMRSALNCYIETINHSFRVGDGGAETLQCSIGFSRGLFEHQEDYIRNPTIPLKKVAPAVQRKTPPAVAPSAPPDTSPSGSSEASILFNGVEYPFAGGQVKRMLLRAAVSNHLAMRTDRNKVDILVAHYTDGPANIANTNAANCRRGFDTEFNKDGTIHNTQTQFIIDHDGTLWQVLDAGRVGYHAGNATGPRSIGVELAVPSPFILPRASDVVPWEKLSGFYVVSPQFAVDHPSTYGPSLAQRTTLAALAKWANTNCAVPLVAPAAVAGSKRLYPIWGTSPQTPTHKLSAGLWHHVEVQQGHADCLGLSLLEVISLAGAM